VSQPHWLSERIRPSGKQSRIDYGVAHLGFVVPFFCQHTPESPKTVRMQFIQRVSTPTPQLPLSTWLDVSHSKRPYSGSGVARSGKQTAKAVVVQGNVAFTVGNEAAERIQ
jgi:hypothetical protein